MKDAKPSVSAEVSRKRREPCIRDAMPGEELTFSIIDEGSDAPDRFRSPSGGGIKAEKDPLPIVTGNFRVRGEAPEEVGVSQ